MKVNFVNIKAQYVECRSELDIAYNRVMESGRYILGQECADFEEEYLDFTGAKYCVSVGSGLDALKLLLAGYGIGIGDEVIAPANTFIATALAVSAVGATIVLVDPSENTYNIDVANVEKAITGRTKAILGVHLYGAAFDIAGLKALSRERGVLLLEDAAQAHGALSKGKKVGSICDGAAFSFYPGKNLGAFGDGGAITTNNKAVADKVRMLRNYGSKEKYIHELAGENSRLDELQASFLRVKLNYINKWNDARRKIAQDYISRIDNRYIELPTSQSVNESVWHLFVLKCKYRAKLMAFLVEKGVEVMIHYPVPIYKQLAYKDMFSKGEGHPVTNKLSSEILSIPLHPHMLKNEVDWVIEVINQFRP